MKGAIFRSGLLFRSFYYSFIVLIKYLLNEEKDLKKFKFKYIIYKNHKAFKSYTDRFD